MEDKDLRDFFESFEPPISEDYKFMTRLERNLDAVEIVNRNNKEYMRRNRLAMIISLIIAFSAGFCCALLMPTIQKLLIPILSNIHITSITLSSWECSVILIWSITTLIIILLSWSAYSISLALIPIRKRG